MKSLLHITLTGVFTFIIFQKSQAQQNGDSLFASGLSLMDQANDWSVKGNPAKSRECYLKAADQFSQTLEITPNYPSAASAIAHCYFEIQQYSQSVNWYVKSLREDSSMATSLAELGLAYLNLENGDSAAFYLRSAARHDSNEKFQKSMSVEIVRLAEKIQGRAYEVSKKDPYKGNEQYWVAVKVLIVAFDLDPYRNEVAKNISDLGFRLNDYDIASKYLQYSVR